MSENTLKNDNMALNQWKQEVLFYQDRISYHCSQKRWDLIDYYGSGNFMFLKISGALFGPPKSENDSGLSKEQEELVSNIISKIKQHSFSTQSCYIAVIYIFAFTHDRQTGCIPLFRLAHTYHLTNGRTPPKYSKFIDNSGRVYDSWDHFLNTNTIEQAHICVPVNGYYSGYDDYEFYDFSSKGLAVRGIDRASTVTTVASCITMIGGAILTLFPPTAPIGATIVTSSIVAGVPGGLWTAGRSIGGLVDRGTHEESINITDSEARKHWLMCTTSILSLGTFGFAKGIALSAQAGKTIPTAVLNVCTGLKVSTVGMTAVGLTDQIVSLATSKEKITAFDILQISTQALILTHGIVTFSTAKAIVQEAQNQKIASFKRFLGLGEQKKFDLLVREDIIKYSCPIKGNQEMIRTLKEVDLKTFLNRGLTNNSNVSKEILKIPPSSSTTTAKTFKMLINKLKMEDVNVISSVPATISFITQVQNIIGLFERHDFFKGLNTTINVIKDILLENRCGVLKLKSFDKIVQKCIEYFIKLITEKRAQNPNPKTSGANVIYHYKHKINDEIKNSNKRHEFKIFLTDLITKSAYDAFAISSFNQDRCDDIIDDMEGRDVPDETKVWKLHDEDILTCTYSTQYYKNTISFFSCGPDSLYVHNERSNAYKKYTFNIDEKIKFLSFNKSVAY